MVRQDTYNSIQSWTEKLLVPVFLISTVFMITSSSNAINYWESPWNQLSVTVACLLPVFMVIIIKAPHWLKGREIRGEMIFIPPIIILGILNVAFGEQFLPNFKGMGLFLLSGLSVFAASIFILKNHRIQAFLLWLYTIALAGIALHTIYVRFWLGYDSWLPLFSDNPIPESTTITLLLSGPLMLFHHQKTQIGRWTLILCLLLGVAAIFILEQRAAMLSLLVIACFFGFFFIKRFWVYFLCAIIVIGISFKIGHEFPKKIPKIIQIKLSAWGTVPVYRMEMYFFTYHLFKKEPLFGVGLWAPLTHHLSDYEEINFTTLKNKKSKFVKFVYSGKNTSFHSLPLCMFVQMGSLFTIAYLGMFGYLLKRFFQHYKESPESCSSIRVLLILLTGFAIQSLALDTLMYPDINFLFHSLLGVAANCKADDPMDKNQSLQN